MSFKSVNMASHPCSWSVRRLNIKTRSCELRFELDADCCGKCLKILPGLSDPTGWFCDVLQSPKSYTNDSNRQWKVVWLIHLLDWLFPKILWLATSFQPQDSGARVPCNSNVLDVQHLDVTKLHVQLMSRSTNTWECELEVPSKEWS